MSPARICARSSATGLLAASAMWAGTAAVVHAEDPPGWSTGVVVEPGTGKADHANPVIAVRPGGGGVVAWTKPGRPSPYDTVVRGFDARGHAAARMQVIPDRSSWAIAADRSGHALLTAGDGDGNFRVFSGSPGRMRSVGLGKGRPSSSFNLGTAAPLATRSGLRLAGVAPLRGGEVYRPASRGTDLLRTTLVPTLAEFSSSESFDSYSVAWAVGGSGVPLAYAHSVIDRGRPTERTERALFRLGGKPAVMPIPGGGSLVDPKLDAAGWSVALVGLADPDETWGDGRVMVSAGTENGLGPQVAVDSPEAEHGYSPSITALPGGGAIVTWVSLPDAAAHRYDGIAQWARIDASGQTVAGGALSTGLTYGAATVRVDGAVYAVWSERAANGRVGLRSARIDDGGVSRVRAPSLTGSGPAVAFSLSSIGAHAALAYEVPGLPVRVSQLR